MKTALMNSDIEVASSMVSSEILSNTLNDPDTDFFVSDLYEFGVPLIIVVYSTVIV